MIAVTIGQRVRYKPLGKRIASGTVVAVRQDHLLVVTAGRRHYVAFAQLREAS